MLSVLDTEEGRRNREASVDNSLITEPEVSIPLIP
jgi:hypothetical protein